MLNFRQRLALAWRILRASTDLNSLKRAQRELERKLPDDPEDGFDMNRHMREGIAEVLLVFSTQGHSGFSAGYAIPLIERLLRQEPISPLTGEPDEWNRVAEDTWQNRRCSHVFKDSEDGPAYTINGYVFEEPDGARYTGSGSRKTITFPWLPEEPEIVRVDAYGEPLPRPEPIAPLIVGEASETVEDLLYDLANLLRGYEAHHRDQASKTDTGPDRSARDTKAERNARYAERIERKLTELAEQAEQPAELAPLALLADAVKGCGLIEQGVGWVKVHALANPTPLFNLLTAAKIAAERA